MKKKILAMILTVTMVLTLLPTLPVLAIPDEVFSTSVDLRNTPADPDDDIQMTFKVLEEDAATSTGTVQVGDGSKTSINDNTAGDITIPATVTYGGITYDITEVAYRAFYYCDSLTNVDASNVEVVGEEAFHVCTALESINLPSAKSIEKKAFSECEKLEKITLQTVKDGEVASLTIGEEVFYNCKELTTVEGNGITELGSYAFSSCRKLKSIDLSNVEIVGNDAFLNCAGLESVVLPTSTESEKKEVTIEDFAFSACEELHTVSGNSIKSLGEDAFYGCSKLKSIDLSFVETVGSSAFENCGSLESVILPTSTDSEKKEVTIGDRAFFYCGALDTVAGNSIKTLGEDAFFFCSKLESLDLSNLTEMGTDALAYCKSLRFLYFGQDYNETDMGAGISSIGSDEELAIYYKQGATGWENTLTVANNKQITPKVYIPLTDSEINEDVVTVGQVLELVMIPVPEGGVDENVVWTVKNAGVTEAQIVDNKWFTAKTPGVVTITATVLNGESLSQDYVKDFDITVLQKPVQGIQLLNTVMLTDGELDLSQDADVLPLDVTYAPIVWTIYDAGSTGATIVNGVFTATNPGDATITATIPDGTAPGEDYVENMNIEILRFPTGIIIEDDSTTVNKELALKGDILPADSSIKEIYWTVKDAGTTNATVTDGTFVATNVGVATVTATIEYQDYVGVNYKKDFEITVTPNPVEEAKDAINAIPEISNIDPDDSIANLQAKDKVDEAIKQVEALTDEQLEELQAQNPEILDALEDAYRDINYQLNKTLEIKDIRVGVSATGTMPLDASGNPVSVKLEATEIADPSTLVNEVMEGFTGTPDIVLSFDVKLMADGQEIQPNGAVKVTFSAPGYEGKTLTVGHKKTSGEWEYFTVTVGADSTFSVNVTEFSPFIVLSNPELIPTGITLSRTSFSMKSGEKTTITATTSPITAVGDIAWISSNPAVATVDANGVVTAVASGTAMITMSIGDVSASATVTVTSDTSPETGDNANLALWAMLALVGAVGIAVLMKKKFAK